MIRNIIRRIITPVSLNEDDARSEFILNVLLLTCIGFSFITFITKVFKGFIHAQNTVPLLVVFLPLCFFLGLYFLSRKGFYQVASYLLLGIFFALVTYQVSMWGTDLPSALLSYVLIIVMAGVLIDTRFAFTATIVISLALALISYLQVNGTLKVDMYWKSEPIMFPDFLVFVIMFIIIATVSWLSNREIERSLIRARKSEAELKQERDSLEVKVEQKTRELKEAQAEKMTQLYRFAEFGRISSAMFHDIVNPLSAVSINIEKVKDGKANSVEEAKEHIARAVLATRKMEDLVATVRKQLSREEHNAVFSVGDEIKQVMEVLSHKAQGAGVEMDLDILEDISCYGDPTKFHYAMLNIFVNSIDAYRDYKNSQCSVKIVVLKDNGQAVIMVEDLGCGISKENLGKIFEPFFTTKSGHQGMGIGLSMTKRMIERDFSGTIEVESVENKGTKFTIKIPIRKAPKD